MRRPCRGVWVPILGNEWTDDRSTEHSLYSFARYGSLARLLVSDLDVRYVCVHIDSLCSVSLGRAKGTRDDEEWISKFLDIALGCGIEVGHEKLNYGRRVDVAAIFVATTTGSGRAGLLAHMQAVAGSFWELRWWWSGDGSGSSSGCWGK